jgi:hypothetical protein
VRDAVGGETVTTPEERAVETGQLQVVQPLTDSSAAPEAVRTAGFADGVQSALNIPVVYGSNVHGVVGVYAGGTEAFSQREQASFETLGEVAGFAITAVRNRNLLLSDSIAEITFELGEDPVLVGLSRSLGSPLRLVGMVPQADDVLLCFVSVEGGGIDRLDRETAGIEAIERARVITESDSGGTAELTIHGSTPLLAISSLGGTVRRASFGDGTGRLVVDLPPDGDVHRIVDTIGREYDAEFVAKEERERSVTTARRSGSGASWRGRPSHLPAIDLVEPIENVLIGQQSSGSGFESVRPFCHRHESLVLVMRLGVQLGFEHRSLGLDTEIRPEGFVGEDPLLLVDNRANVLTIDRLAEIIVERHIEYLDSGVDRGYHDHPPVVATVDQFRQYVITRHPRHMTVQKDDIDRRISDRRERGFSTVHRLDIAVASQSECVCVRYLLLVVDDERAHVRRAVVPCHLSRCVRGIETGDT